MKQVEYFYWMLPPDSWRKKPGRSTYLMDAETAQKRYPGATPIEGTMELRAVCETPEETRREMAKGQNPTFPPRGM